MKKLLILLIFLLLLPTVLAEIPKHKGYVTDNANILGDYGPKIEQLCEEIEKNTTAEVAVLTIESLEGMPLETYSLEVARSWGIGKEDKNNGLLLLISVKDRKYRFETGYGLEGVLPDAKTGRIGRRILTPAFKLKEYGRGVYEALSDIKGLLQEDPSIVAKYKPTVMSNFGGFIVFGYLIVFLAVLVLTEKRKHKWKTRTGADAAIIIGSIFLGLTFFIIAFVMSIMFWILAAQISWMAKHKSSRGIIWGRGRSSGGFGGGFGGFGGGSFGGGGSSGGW